MAWCVAGSALFDACVRRILLCARNLGTHTHTHKEIVNASCTIVYATCFSVFPAAGIGGRGGDVEENCVVFFFGDVLGFRDIKETQALYFIVKHRLETGERGRAR